MSADFYFKRWLQTLQHLEKCVNFDRELQMTKHNDKTRCSAVQTLVGVMGEYCSIYNDAMECSQQNRQLQKTVYIAAVVNAVVARITEIKHQLQKLESTNYQFLGQGLIDHKITVFDVEMKEIPAKLERTESINVLIEQAFQGAQRRKEEMDRLAIAEEVDEEQREEVVEWWKEDQDNAFYFETEQKTDFTESYKVEKVISEETLEKRKLVAMIQAHERTRKVTQQNRLDQIKREMWTKQLAGTLNPETRLELKERSAMLIQKFFRAYFGLKRQKKIDCRRDELLGLSICSKPSYEGREKVAQMLEKRMDLRKKYEVEWSKLCKDLKRKYAQKSDDIAEEFRDHIRDWFMQWYKEVQLFHNIPPENKGGSALIVKDEVPTPSEWLEEYQEYLRIKTANKGKTALQLKYEKEIKNKEGAVDIRQELRKKKRGAELLRKIMKNPTLHPGFTYPKSKKTEQIMMAIQGYRKVWSLLDLCGEIEAKEGTLQQLDVDKVCMEVKMEVRKVVDEEMREELKLLKNALKKDYEKKGEKIPGGLKTLKKVKKQRKKQKIKNSDDLVTKMEELVLNGVMKEYPKTKLEDFIGEYNFAGSDHRCLYIQGRPYGGETRNIWWERAREILLGLQKILLVGPKGSGKTTLVYGLASVNDAVLLELDPQKLAEEGLTSESLAELVDTVVSCAKAVQPCVIYLRNIHRLYLTKKHAKRESNPNNALMRKSLVGKLCKINKNENIIVVATCTEPWLTRSAQLMKKFPSVVLIPDMNYTTVVKILSDWVLSNHTIPPDLNVHSLAHLLRGYSFAFLKKALDNFMTADRIIKIAAYGLKPQEVYDFIMEFHEEARVGYDQYIKWYSEKTVWGKKELKSIEAELEFKALKEKYEEKMERKKEKSRRAKEIVETSELDSESEGI